jgi:hypothetical protein
MSLYVFFDKSNLMLLIVGDNANNGETPKMEK